MELAAIGFILFASALIQGLSGFGSAMVSMAFLPFVMDLQMAVPLVAVNSLLSNLFNFHFVRHHFIFKEFLPLLLGSIIGAPGGIMILKYVDPLITRKIVGIFILSYSLYCLIYKKQEIKKLKKAWGYLAGLAAGIFGGACTVNGPPVVIYLTTKFADKHCIKSISAGFFLSAGLVNIILFALNGFYTLTVSKYCAAFAVFAIIGVALGNHYYKRISQEAFKKFVYVFLVIMGVTLIFKDM